jgi:DNA-directed RNA polymerase subunit RPC12/RpoP
MKKHYLHLSVYRCAQCQGPVVTGSLAVRENEISKETEKQNIGSICLSCGHRQSAATGPARIRHLLPIDWPPADSINASPPTMAFVDALNRVDLHREDKP